MDGVGVVVAAVLRVCVCVWPMLVVVVLVVVFVIRRRNRIRRMTRRPVPTAYGLYGSSRGGPKKKKKRKRTRKRKEGTWWGDRHPAFGPLERGRVRRARGGGTATTRLARRGRGI